MSNLPHISKLYLVTPHTWCHQDAAAGQLRAQPPPFAVDAKAAAGGCGQVLPCFS